MILKPLGLLVLVAAAAAVPAALWFSTTERHVSGAAAAILPIITPDDLVIIDGNLPFQADPGGLIRPFAPFAAVVMTPEDPQPELSTFPQKRVFLVGKHWEGLAGPSAQRLADGVLMVEPVHQGELLVTMTDRLRVSVEQGGVQRPCSQRHPSGGVKCGGQPWQWVGPSVVTANGKRHACLWAHPVHQHRLHLDVPVPGPARASLWLQFADEAINDSAHPAILINASVDGNVVSSVTCTNDKPGRCPVVVDVPQGAPGFRLSLETVDAARQLVCLGGEVVTNP